MRTLRARTGLTRAAGRMGTSANLRYQPSDTPGLTDLDADDIAGADGDAVASWTSKGAVIKAFAQADNTKQPLLKKGMNGIYGHNSVLFDGVNDLLTIAENLFTSQTGTVFAVYRITDQSKLYQVVLESALAASNARYVRLTGYQTPTNPRAQIDQRNADTGNGVSSTRIKQAATTYIVCWQSTGSAWAVRSNGEADALAVTVANNGDWWGDTTQDTWTIGASKSTSEILHLDGDITRILIWPTALDAADIAKVETYLSQRYGVTIPNPVDLDEMTLKFHAADVAADGTTIYALVGAVVKKSTDSGATWTDKVTLAGTPTGGDRVFVAANGYVYACPSGGVSDQGLYRSIDGGDNWTNVLPLDANCSIWGFDEDASGNLYAGEYSVSGAGKTQIWKSTDDGANWVQKYTHETAGQDHIHDLRVSPVTGYIYATTGDTDRYILRSVDAGENWSVIWTSASNVKYAAIAFAGGYVYLGTDESTAGVNGIHRIQDNTDAAVIPEIAYDLPDGLSGNVLAAQEHNGKMVFGTDNLSVGGTNQNPTLIVYDGTWRTVETLINTWSRWTTSRHASNGAVLIGNGTSATVSTYGRKVTL